MTISFKILYQLKCLSSFIDFELQSLEIIASQMVSFFLGGGYPVLSVDMGKLKKHETLPKTVVLLSV